MIPLPQAIFPAGCVEADEPVVIDRGNGVFEVMHRFVCRPDCGTVDFVTPDFTPLLSIEEEEP